MDRRIGQAGATSEPVLLEVEGLCKRFPTFELHDIGFSVEAGSITGFIGRNGAGKTTTIKCIMGAERPDAGEIRYFGKPFKENVVASKSQTGFVLGAATYYPTKRLSTIASVVSRFYPEWDDAAFQGFLREFNLDPAKRVKELSQGMCVKFALALALSHKARLLILDEPTSGLDPLSREELLDVFLDLAARGCGILFSTQITSDLDKCADSIVYIKQGRLVAAEATNTFRDSYRVVPLEDARAADAEIVGTRRSANGATALVKTASSPDLGRAATLEDIMVHEEGGEPLGEGSGILGKDGENHG